MTTLKHAFFALALACCGMAGAANPTSVFIEPLDLSELTIHSPDTYFGAGRQDFVLTEKEQMQLRSGFKKSTQKAFASNDEFKLVDDPANADIVVRAQLAELSPTAPKDDFHSRQPNQKIVTRGAGTAKFAFHVAKEGEYEIVSEDKLHAGRTWERNDRMNNTRRFKQLLRTASNRLLKSLVSYEA